MSENRGPRRLYYGYVIVALAFFIGAVAWGSQRTFGVFLDPLLRQYEWSRAAASLAFTIGMIMTGVLSILAGRLSDRFGPRIVLTACGIFIGAGYLLLSRLTGLWQFYLVHGLLIAAGMAGIMVPLTSMVIRWFTRRAGLVNGIIQAGPGFGITVVPPVVSWLISQYEWRNSYLLLGTGVLVMIVASSQFVRRGPTREETSGQDAGAAVPVINPVSHTFRQAAGTREFWLLCVLFFVDLFCVNVVMVHLVVHLTGTGVPLAAAVSVLAVTSAMSIGGRIVAGAVADRIGRRTTIAIGTALSLMAFAWLPFASETWMLYAFAAAFGVGGWSVGAVLSPMIAEYFGLKSHGVILGAVTFAGTVGGALGPLLAGGIFDIMKTYDVAFVIGAALSGLALVLLLFLRPPQGVKR